MLHIRFIDIILWVFLVLYTLKNSSMHAHQGDESKEYVVSVRKVFDEGFRGRKMGGHEVGVDSKNSGANYSYDGKCKTWDHETKVERDDFVAFGDDYGGPKRHPPEHN